MLSADVMRFWQENKFSSGTQGSIVMQYFLAELKPTSGVNNFIGVSFFSTS